VAPDVTDRPHSPARVLIVDDDPQIVEVLEELLAELGYDRQSAGTGPEALRLVPEFRPDVVLLDLGLPDMPGQVVLERLRGTDPGLPVVMLTGNTDTELARRTLAQGAFDYVEKPFSLTRLEQVLAAALAYRG
jgi:DNA-binding response OmpR family regulator